MTTAQKRMPPMVQTYDYSKVREYIKKYTYAVWSSEEIVRTDAMENKLIMHITSEKMPDEIIFNGKQVKLVNI